MKIVLTFFVLKIQQSSIICYRFKIHNNYALNLNLTDLKAI
jgi:hypothetical protein